MFALCARGVACGYEVRFASDVAACKRISKRYITLQQSCETSCNAVAHHFITFEQDVYFARDVCPNGQVKFVLRATDGGVQKRQRALQKNIIIKTKYILFFLVIYSISCYNNENNRLQPIKEFVGKAYNYGFVAVKKIRSEEGILLRKEGLVEFFCF